MYDPYLKKREWIDMAVALIILSIGFSLVLTRSTIFRGIDFVKLLQVLPISMFILLFAFLGHEIAHRQVARRLGYHAFFQADYQLLPLALILPLFFGFIFAAPGAVVISPFRLYGRGGDRDVFFIAAAGPLTNITFAAVGIAAYTLTKAMLWWYFTYINAWLALFNLLPIPPLDGSKMIKTNLAMWMLIFGMSLLLLWFVW